MTRETVNRISVLFSFFLSFLSFLVSVITGSDVSYMLIERSFIVFAISTLLIWAALTLINRIASSDRNTISQAPGNPPKSQPGAHTRDNPPPTGSSREAHKEVICRRENPHLTPTPQEELDVDHFPESEEKPEIRELEPFNPRRVETDWRKEG